MSSALQLGYQHIIKHLTDIKPLFVGLQGPQGSGKTFLASQLRTRLLADALRVAVLSVDDLYLSHDELVALSQSRNPLWKGRGLPGTHDTVLGVDILSRLKSACSNVELPRFDKSLYGGEGDRLPLDGTGTVIKQPPTVDVVILEGWLVGFRPILNRVLQERWEGIWKDERQKLGLSDTVRLADIRLVNDKLHEYLPLWSFFDIFIQLKANPPPSLTLSQYSVIYKWRWEQENYMKARNGGRGMSETAVKRFVDRYIPGYVFFSGLLPVGPPEWGLVLSLDEARNVTGVGYL